MKKKRKSMSMKLLYKLAIEYLTLDCWDQLQEEVVEVKKNVIVDYLDFVFKNKDKSGDN